MPDDQGSPFIDSKREPKNNSSQNEKKEQSGPLVDAKQAVRGTAQRSWRIALGLVVVVVGAGVWLYLTRSLVADYAPLVLVFISAIAAIAGKSWDEDQKGFARVTVQGRILGTLAVLGLLVGIRSTQISHSKLREAGRIQSVAYHQLMEGVSMMLFPITSSWRERPKNDVDILVRAQDRKTVDLLAKTRIVPFADPVRDMMMMTEDPRMFGLTANGVRISSSCGQTHRGFRALYELFDFCIDGGEARVKESEQIFISNLDPETIELVQNVLADDFYVSHYKNLAQHDDLYYQGLYDEASAQGRSMSSDRTWRAMLAVQRALLPEKNRQNNSAPKETTSPYLYLGTYYFGHDPTDATAYRTFLQKVGKLVKHVGTLTSSTNVIDTF